MPADNVLTTLFKHHLWANLRLLEACANLTPEQLDTTMVGAFGSIIVTWRHIATSEQSYFSRISTGKRYDRPANEPPMTFAQMEAALRTTGEGLIEWSVKVSGEDMVEVDWEGTPRKMPKTMLFAQVINHATEHREQIKTMMTQIGIEPPDLQGWAFFHETDTSDWTPADS